VWARQQEFTLLPDHEFSLVGEGTEIMADEDHGRSIVLMAVGAVVVLIALFLPLFTVRYAPPGGSAVLYGHSISAFTEKITGWQFATTASYTRLLWVFVALLGITALRLFWAVSGKEPATLPAAKYVHALAHSVIAVGWLLLLGFAVLVGTESMPTDGEKGVLASFATNPFSSAARNSLGNPTTAHLSATLGIGWILLLIGIALGALGIWKKVTITAVAVAALLFILHFVSHPLSVFVSDLVGF
jgi:hypothetical protein